jgi:hypothetical protein
MLSPWADEERTTEEAMRAILTVAALLASSSFGCLTAEEPEPERARSAIVSPDGMVLSTSSDEAEFGDFGRCSGDDWLRCSRACCQAAGMTAVGCDWISPSNSVECTCGDRCYATELE